MQHCDDQGTASERGTGVEPHRGGMGQPMRVIVVVVAERRHVAQLRETRIGRSPLSQQPNVEFGEAEDVPSGDPMGVPEARVP